MARAVGPARVQHTMADRPSSSAARRAACAIATVTALVEGARRRVRPRSYVSWCRSSNCSARAAMRAIVATVRAGSWPMAVSAESIRAAVPSKTALATSVASARVGVGAVTIDSSICVAVMHRAALGRMQSRMMRFCRWGTSSIEQSMPRSPRATITPSGRLDDVVQVVDGGAGLDLGDNRGPSGRGRVRTRRSRGRSARTRPPPSRRRLGEGVEDAQVLVGGDVGQPAVGREVRAGPALQRGHRSRRGPRDSGAVTVDGDDVSVMAPSPRTRRSPGPRCRPGGARRR